MVAGPLRARLKGRGASPRTVEGSRGAASSQRCWDEAGLSESLALDGVCAIETRRSCPRHGGGRGPGEAMVRLGRASGVLEIRNSRSESV